MPFSSGAQKLLQELIALDFNDPQPFTVRGGDLMQLEQITLSVYCLPDRQAFEKFKLFSAVRIVKALTKDV